MTANNKTNGTGDEKAEAELRVNTGTLNLVNTTLSENTTSSTSNPS